MKKMILTVLECMAVLMLLTGCVKTTECAECHRKKECKQYTIVYGEKEIKEYVCDECFTLLGPFVELAGGYIK